MEQETGLVGIIAGNRHSDWMRESLPSVSVRLAEPEGEPIGETLRRLHEIAVYTVIVDDDLIADDEEAQDSLCEWAKNHAAPKQRIILFSDGVRDGDDPLLYRLVSDCGVTDILMAESCGDPGKRLDELMHESTSPLEYEQWQTHDERMWARKKPGLLSGLFRANGKDKKKPAEGKKGKKGKKEDKVKDSEEKESPETEKEEFAAEPGSLYDLYDEEAEQKPSANSLVQSEKSPAVADSPSEAELDLTDDETVQGLWTAAKKMTSEINPNLASQLENVEADSSDGRSLRLLFPASEAFTCQQASKPGSLLGHLLAEALPLVANGATVPFEFTVAEDSKPAVPDETANETDPKKQPEATGAASHIGESPTEILEAVVDDPETPTAKGLPEQEPPENPASSANEGPEKPSEEDADQTPVPLVRKAGADVRRAAPVHKQVDDGQDASHAEAAKETLAADTAAPAPAAMQKETGSAADAGGTGTAAAAKTATGRKRKRGKAGAPEAEEAGRQDDEAAKRPAGHAGGAVANGAAAGIVEDSEDKMLVQLVPPKSAEQLAEDCSSANQDAFFRRVQQVSIPKAGRVFAISSIRSGIGCTHTAAACGVAAATAGLGACVALRTRASLNRLRDHALEHGGESLHNGRCVRWRGCDFYAWQDQRQFGDDYELCIADCGVIDRQAKSADASTNVFMNFSSHSCLLISMAPWDIELFSEVTDQFGWYEVRRWTLGLHSSGRLAEKEIGCEPGEAQALTFWRQPYYPDLFYEEGDMGHGLDRWLELLLPALSANQRQSLERLMAESQNKQKKRKKPKKQEL